MAWPLIIAMGSQRCRSWFGVVEAGIDNLKRKRYLKDGIESL